MVVDNSFFVSNNTSFLWLGLLVGGFALLLGLLVGYNKFPTRSYYSLIGLSVIMSGVGLFGVLALDGRVADTIQQKESIEAYYGVVIADGYEALTRDNTTIPVTIIDSDGEIQEAIVHADNNTVILEVTEV